MKFNSHFSLSFLILLFFNFGFGKFPSEKSTSNSANRISVRESTVDLQVRVGERLFVFGKASGNLEKVKVGMNVLEFAQSSQIEGLNSSLKKVEWKKQKDCSILISSQIEGLNSSLKKVEWKKQKDGTILIRSSYEPWPSQLSWIIDELGQLKMEVSPNTIKNTGLGFDIPESDLRKLVLDSKEENQLGVTKSFHSAEIEFSEVSLKLKSASGEMLVSTSFIQPQKGKSDLIFSFPGISEPSDLPLQSPGDGQKQKATSTSVQPFILWFDFH